MSDVEDRARRWKENRNLVMEVSVYGVGRSLAMELADIVDDIVQWKTRRDGIRQRYHYKIHRKGVLDTLPHGRMFFL
jgi:hypothetical protein